MMHKGRTAGKKSTCQTRPEARASRILLGERPPMVMACDSSPAGCTLAARLSMGCMGHNMTTA
jgi:alkanesulfonate monooxygenase SsuD/methylene tetrahydromethanopterin reductase-like flavin-dependent oxidoreductase (luciferase family)